MRLHADEQLLGDVPHGDGLLCRSVDGAGGQGHHDLVEVLGDRFGQGQRLLRRVLARHRVPVECVVVLDELGSVGGVEGHGSLDVTVDHVEGTAHHGRAPEGPVGCHVVEQGRQAVDEADMGRAVERFEEGHDVALARRLRPVGDVHHRFHGGLLADHQQTPREEREVVPVPVHVQRTGFRPVRSSGLRHGPDYHLFEGLVAQLGQQEHAIGSVGRLREQRARHLTGHVDRLGERSDGCELLVEDRVAPFAFQERGDVPGRPTREQGREIDREDPASVRRQQTDERRNGLGMGNLDARAIVAAVATVVAAAAATGQEEAGQYDSQSNSY